MIATHLRGTFTCAVRRRSACASRARAGGSSSSAPPPGSSATSARPTTPRPRPASSAFARTWALELARAQITVNAIDPDRLDRDDGEHPRLRAARRALERGEPLPRAGAPRARDRHARGLRPARRVPGLRRGRRRSPGRRSGSAATGSRCGRIRLRSSVALPRGWLERRADRREWEATLAASRQQPTASSSRRLDLDGAGTERSTSSGSSRSTCTCTPSAHAQAAGPGHHRDPGRGRDVLRRRPAAADRAGGRRLLPRAQHARGHLHRRRRGRDGPRRGSATTRCSRPRARTPTC